MYWYNQQQVHPSISKYLWVLSCLQCAMYYKNDWGTLAEVVPNYLWSWAQDQCINQMHFPLMREHVAWQEISFSAYITTDFHKMSNMLSWVLLVIELYEFLWLKACRHSQLLYPLRIRLNISMGRQNTTFIFLVLKSFKDKFFYFVETWKFIRSSCALELSVPW